MGTRRRARLCTLVLFAIAAAILGTTLGATTITTAIASAAFASALFAASSAPTLTASTIALTSATAAKPTTLTSTSFPISFSAFTIASTNASAAIPSTIASTAITAAFSTTTLASTLTFTHATTIASAFTASAIATTLATIPISFPFAATAIAAATLASPAFTATLASAAAIATALATATATAIATALATAIATVEHSANLIDGCVVEVNRIGNGIFVLVHRYRVRYTRAHTRRTWQAVARTTNYGNDVLTLLTPQLELWRRKGDWKIHDIPRPPSIRLSDNPASHYLPATENQWGFPTQGHAWNWNTMAMDYERRMDDDWSRTDVRKRWERFNIPLGFLGGTHNWWNTTFPPDQRRDREEDFELRHQFPYMMPFGNKVRRA
jgi:hypothetical protein